MSSALKYEAMQFTDNLAFSQLGLMVSVDPTTWQRAYCYAHRVFIYGLLVFTCVLQNVVCFRRDGFVITLQLSNGNETVCSTKQHLIISNIALKILVIIAYTLLLVYFTLWEPENIQKVSNLPTFSYMCDSYYCTVLIK